ncbi:MAG TPA: hypothetical protein VES00_13995, partial [Burkholderiaceae bacterium]|nr:hypothetical protein [Burkholderiaceae bacterium]
ARRLGRMTRTTAFASMARAAKRAGGASCVLAAMARASTAGMCQQHVVGAVARSPDPGRS